LRTKIIFVFYSESKYAPTSVECKLFEMVLKIHERTNYFCSWPVLSTAKNRTVQGNTGEICNQIALTEQKMNVFQNESFCRRNFYGGVGVWSESSRELDF